MEKFPIFVFGVVFFVLFLFVQWHINLHKLFKVKTIFLRTTVILFNLYLAGIRGSLLFQGY